MRRLLSDAIATGRHHRRPSLRGGSNLGFCCWWLVTASQAQPSEPAAYCVATALEMTRDLRGTLSRGPELFQLCQFSSIPAHGRYFSASCDVRLVYSSSSSRTTADLVSCSFILRKPASRVKEKRVLGARGPYRDKAPISSRNICSRVATGRAAGCHRGECLRPDVDYHKSEFARLPILIGELRSPFRYPLSTGAEPNYHLTSAVRKLQSSDDCASSREAGP